MKKQMNTKVTVSLDDSKLLKLLKIEAQQTNSTVKSVLIKAVEAYFFHKLEFKALQKASESVLEEWTNDLDSNYDKL